MEGKCKDNCKCKDTCVKKGAMDIKRKSTDKDVFLEGALAELKKLCYVFDYAVPFIKENINPEEWRKSKTTFNLITENISAMYVKTYPGRMDRVIKLVNGKFYMLKNNQS